MPLSFLFSKKTGGRLGNDVLGELQLDATIRDIHDYENEVTQWPIEDGASINDHIRVKPDRLTIDGFVTNAPLNILGILSSEIVTRIKGGFDFKNFTNTSVPSNVETALDFLLAATGRVIDGEPQSPQLIDVVTGLRKYRNMAITSVNIPRDAQTGQALRFTLQMIEVKTIPSETIQIPNAAVAVVDKAQSTVDKNKQTPKEVPPNDSTLFKIGQGIKRKAGQF